MAAGELRVPRAFRCHFNLERSDQSMKAIPPQTRRSTDRWHRPPSTHTAVLPVCGPLIDAGLVDELFLTIAPQIAGRTASRPRLAVVEGRGYEIGPTPWATLGSVMRAGDHLFLRYGLTGHLEALENEHD